MTGTSKNFDDRRENTLYSQLLGEVAGHGCRHFAVYALDGEDLRLAFSCGTHASLESSEDGRLRLSDYPVLEALLSGEHGVLLRGMSGNSTTATAFLEQVGAAAAFRLATADSALGFVIVSSTTPELVPGSSTVAELERVFAVFSEHFAQDRSADASQRLHVRAESKLRELQHGLGLLLLPDQGQIVRTVLRRALDVLGCVSGTLWIRRGQRWGCDYVIGRVAPSNIDALASLLERSRQMGKAGLISSLSGEETWDFDVETIHIASVVLFPLKTRSQFVGCIAAFDATVSLDVVDVVEGVALVGAAAIENRQNSQSMLERERLATDMSLAAKMQKRLLPPSGQAHLVGVSVAHFSSYCDDAGGDYVDVVEGSEPYVCNFAVGDVSGHGLGAAMLMVDLRARLRTQMDLMLLWSPTDLLSYLNKALYAESAPEEFVTLFLGSLDVRTGILRYGSAGQEPPVLYRARSQKWQQLPSTGLPLGMDGDSLYEEISLVVETGDILVCPTDGATEATDPNDVAFGLEGVRAAVERKCGADAHAIVDELVSSTFAHCQGTPFADDVAYLVIKIEHIRIRIQSVMPTCAGIKLHEAAIRSGGGEKDRQLAVIRTVAERECGADANGIYMSIEEALTNVIHHGAEGRDDCTLELQLWRNGDSFVVDLSHDGVPFDVQNVLPGPANERDFKRVNGRGVLIMATFMDDVLYTPDGRHMQMCVRLSGKVKS